MVEDNTTELFTVLQSDKKSAAAIDVVRMSDPNAKKETEDRMLQYMEVGLSERRETQGVANMACMAMKAQRYDAVYLGFAGALLGAVKQSEMLTRVMCMEIDRLLQQVCEAAAQNGFAVVVVGTDGLATRVPQGGERTLPLVKVPCVVVPAQGAALEKKECRAEGKK